MNEIDQFPDELNRYVFVQFLKARLMIPKSFKLNNGFSIPSVGLGLYKLQKTVTEKAVSLALSSGYQHFDSGSYYGNEMELGTALKRHSNIPRQEIFVASKLWKINWKDPESLIAKSLSTTRLDYFDLYLMHWPLLGGKGLKVKKTNPEEIHKVWKIMEDLVQKGLTNSIGVSNFTVEQLQQLEQVASIKPACNQIELHPYFQQKDMVEYCAENDIAITAFSPLGSGTGERAVINDPIVIEISKKLGITPAQVLISWAVQKGFSVIPKSGNPEHIAENINITQLPESDMALLKSLDRNLRYFEP